MKKLTSILLGVGISIAALTLLSSITFRLLNVASSSSSSTSEEESASSAEQPSSDKSSAQESSSSSSVEATATIADVIAYLEEADTQAKTHAGLSFTSTVYKSNSGGTFYWTVVYDAPNQTITMTYQDQTDPTYTVTGVGTGSEVITSTSSTTWETLNETYYEGVYDTYATSGRASQLLLLKGVLDIEDQMTCDISISGTKMSATIEGDFVDSYITKLEFEYDDYILVKYRQTLGRQIPGVEYVYE